MIVAMTSSTKRYSMTILTKSMISSNSQETIPLNSEDFKAHIQNEKHKTDTDQQLSDKTSDIDENLDSNESSDDETSSVSSGCTSSSDDEFYSQFDSALESKSTRSENGVESRCSHSTCETDSKHSREPAKQLQDNVNVEEILHATVSGLVDVSTRSEERIQYEEEIMDCIKNHMRGLDCEIELEAFGSSTYGFGDSSTNFNIVVNAGKQNIRSSKFSSYFH